MPLKNKFKLLILICLVVLIFPQPAKAYIDMGSGSYFIQIIAASIIGIILSIKSVWNNIILTIKNIFQIKNKDSENDTNKE